VKYLLKENPLTGEVTRWPSRPHKPGRTNWTSLREGGCYCPDCGLIEDRTSRYPTTPSLTNPLGVVEGFPAWNCPNAEPAP